VVGKEKRESVEGRKNDEGRLGIRVGGKEVGSEEVRRGARER
jgi:hypothetical protein